MTVTVNLPLKVKLKGKNKPRQDANYAFAVCDRYARVFFANKVTKFRMGIFSKAQIFSSAFTFCTTNTDILDCIISEGCDNSNYFVFPSGAR